MPFRVFPIDFSTIYLNYIIKFLLYLTEPANSPRLKDNFMARITLGNDKLGYTLIGCQGLFLLGVMLGLVNLFVDISP